VLVELLVELADPTVAPSFGLIKISTGLLLHLDLSELVPEVFDQLLTVSNRLLAGPLVPFRVGSHASGARKESAQPTVAVQLVSRPGDELFRLHQGLLGSLQRLPGVFRLSSSIGRSVGENGSICVAFSLEPFGLPLGIVECGEGLRGLAFHRR
jgi:hypothetical protein